MEPSRRTFPPGRDPGRRQKYSIRPAEMEEKRAISFGKNKTGRNAALLYAQIELILFVMSITFIRGVYYDYSRKEYTQYFLLYCK
jgi:hypothetical protein